MPARYPVPHGMAGPGVTAEGAEYDTGPAVTPLVNPVTDRSVTLPPSITDPAVTPNSSVTPLTSPVTDVTDVIASIGITPGRRRTTHLSRSWLNSGRGTASGLS